MKTKFLMIAALSLFALSGGAESSPQTATEHWHGTGTVSSVAGQTQGTYNFDLTVQKISATASQSTSVITFADGTTKTISQTDTVNASGSVSIASNIGQGGGACFGNNMCEFYIQDAGGKAYAINVAVDADGSRRDLITILQDGSAVEFLSEKVAQVR